MTIKKKIGLITRDIAEDTTFAALGLTGYAKTIDFYNYGETVAMLHFTGDNAVGAPGVRLEAGQNFTIEGHDDLGIDMSGISIEFADVESTKAINMTIESHNIIR